MDETSRKQIMEAFIRIIDHFSDKEYQRRAWIKGEEADFDEAACLFFELGDPVLENYEEFGITKTQYPLLKNFHDKFKAFSDENDLPPEFIDTPEWNEITLMAKEVLVAFNYKKRR